MGIVHTADETRHAVARTLQFCWDFCFLGGQILVWNNLRYQGAFLDSNPSRSLFYIITGTHAVHLVGVVDRPAICAGRTPAGNAKFEIRKELPLRLPGWYWHYLAFLWFGIFALVHFAKG